MSRVVGKSAIALAIVANIYIAANYLQPLIVEGLEKQGTLRADVKEERDRQRKLEFEEQNLKDISSAPSLDSPKTVPDIGFYAVPMIKNGLEKQRAKEANTKEVNEVSIVKEVNDIKENLGRRKLEEQNWKAIAAASLDKRDNK